MLTGYATFVSDPHFLTNDLLDEQAAEQVKPSFHWWHKYMTSKLLTLESDIELVDLFCGVGKGLPFCPSTFFQDGISSIPNESRIWGRALAVIDICCRMYHIFQA